MSTVVSDEKATAKTAPKEYRQFIGGEWVGASSGATYPDRNPFTGEPMATIPASTRDDAKRAVKAAAEAFPAWWKTPPGAKQRLFLKAADILERRQMEMVGLLASETGCTFGFGMFQTIFTPNLLRQVAGLVYQPVGEILPADLPGALYMGVRQPVGVVAGLAPWNAPLILSLRSIATPLAFGNTVVLKPSEESPITGGLLYAEIFEEAGFPAGVVNVVTHAPGQAEPVVDEFMENPKVRRISFTGSTKTGRILAEKAARHGARVLTGGKVQGTCYEPTLLTDMPDGVAMSKEETFGPVATITIVDDADEAVRVANQTTYGLSAGILTSEADRGLAFAERIEAGIVHINDQPVNDEPQVPFGGVKDSGYGRFGGGEAMHEFTEMRWVTVQGQGGRPFPF